MTTEWGGSAQEMVSYRDIAGGLHPLNDYSRHLVNRQLTFAALSSQADFGGRERVSERWENRTFFHSLWMPTAVFLPQFRAQ